MIKNAFIRSAISLLLVMEAAFAHAEDIDIFSANTTVTADAPNVLIVMDNTANWSQSFASSTKFAAEMTALQSVVSALKAQFNLGIMAFTETGGSNSNTDGGYVRFAIQAMTDSSGNATAARNCLLKMVGSGAACGSSNANYSVLDIGLDKSNGGKAGVTFGEVYDYYKGLNAYAGNNKVKADPLAFVSGTIAGPQYKTPVAGGCQKNFVIVISNGPFQDNTSSTSTAMSQLSAAGGDTTIINPPDTSSNNNASDEWTRFLNKSSLNVVTYTLEVGPSATGQGPYNTALLQSMGRQGKGGYYSAVDSTTLLAALTRIFNDIQAVNSVFASSSLPLSADNSGSYLNQVYMGVFRPDAQGKPRWYGNLKEYQFALDSNNNLYLADSLGIAAASASTGFAQPNAVSYWTSVDTTKAPDATAVPSTGSTTGSTGGFWYFDSKGAGGNYDSPDGEWVEKGGAAQQLRLAYLGYGNRGGIGDANTATLNSKPARQVLTCTGTCLNGTYGAPAALSAFDSTNSALTDVAFGLATQLTGVTFTADALITGGTAVVGQTGIAITSIKTTGSTTVATTSTVVAGCPTVVPSTVTISGNAFSGYNGTNLIVTACTANSITFNPLSTTGSSQSGGTATVSGSTVLVTLAQAYAVGDIVTLSGFGNTALNVSAPVLSATSSQFTYAVAAPQPYSSSSGVSVFRNLATATTPSAHGLAVGDSVTISGASPAGYNGTVLVKSVPSTTSFTYYYGGSTQLAAGTGGTANKSGSASAVTNLIEWIRGQDVLNENGFQVAGLNTDVRASIHGDVLHSRPVILNYSSNTTSNNVYLFYGGNDGVFRAVKGGQAATDGVEQWAFIAPEFFAKFNRLYNNSPLVKYSSTPAGTTPTPTARDYFWDGPVGTYIERNSSDTVTKAYLYIAVRRGGRFIYALDVTSPTAPKFMWRKGCSSLTDNSTCDAGFAEMGQTWSQPQVVKVKGNTNPVLIFGAGYDSVIEDSEVLATLAGGDTMGRGVYVLDAFTGALVWSAGNSANGPTLAVTGMNFSIAADVLPIDRNTDGYADRVYAADVGGNVWRLDIDDASTANWKVWKIASVGSRSAIASARKILFGMDVVFGTVVAGKTFDAVVIGTGDREHPLSTNAANGVANRVYMFEDTNTGTAGANLGIVDSCGATVASTCSNLYDATSSSSVPSTAIGWSVNLASGEKVVNAPVVVGGSMLFGTNQPDTSSASCTANLGIARRYSINFLNGAGTLFTDSSGNVVTAEVAVGGGFLPTTVTGVVEINGNKILFATDNPLNPGGAFTPSIVVPTKRFRTYWYQKID